MKTQSSFSQRDNLYASSICIKSVISGACLFLFPFDRMFICWFDLIWSEILYFNGKWFIKKRLWNWTKKKYTKVFAYITINMTIKFGIDFACCTSFQQNTHFHRLKNHHKDMINHFNFYNIWDTQCYVSATSQETINYYFILSKSNVAAFFILFCFLPTWK